MRLSLGIRSLIAVAAVGTLLSATGKPALAIDAEITADPVAWPAWIVQAANMATTIADDVQRYTQLETEISQGATQVTQGIKNLKYLGTLASNSFGSMQKFANLVVTVQNEFPTTAGYELAKNVVAEQNGSLSSGALDTLKNEILGAQGNLQAQQSTADIGLAQLTQAHAQAQYEATQKMMEEAQTQDAVKERAALLDLNSQDPTAGMLY